MKRRRKVVWCRVPETGSFLERELQRAERLELELLELERLDAHGDMVEPWAPLMWWWPLPAQLMRGTWVSIPFGDSADPVGFVSLESKHPAGWTIRVWSLVYSESHQTFVRNPESSIELEFRFAECSRYAGAIWRKHAR